jgi:hypothetical protein
MCKTDSNQKNGMCDIWFLFSVLYRVTPGGGAVDRPERRAVRRERDGRDDSM